MQYIGYDASPLPLLDKPGIVVVLGGGLGHHVLEAEAGKQPCST